MFGASPSLEYPTRWIIANLAGFWYNVGTFGIRRGLVSNGEEYCF